MQVTLTKVGTNNTDKDKKPLIDKNGKGYHKAYFKCNEHGDKYVSKNYCNEQEIAVIKAWKVGDTIEVDIAEEPYNGKMYLNFNLPKKGVSRKEFTELQDYCKSLEERLIELEKEILVVANRSVNAVSDLEIPTDDEPPF